MNIVNEAATVSSGIFLISCAGMAGKGLYDVVKLARKRRIERLSEMYVKGYKAGVYESSLIIRVTEVTASTATIKAELIDNPLVVKTFIVGVGDRIWISRDTDLLNVITEAMADEPEEDE